MPRQGYENITVKEAVYKKLSSRADKESRSVANLAELLITEGLKSRGSKN